MKFSIFIHPPRPKPRRVTTWPSPSTICDPCVVRMFVDIENLSCVIICNEEETRYHLYVFVRCKGAQDSRAIRVVVNSTRLLSRGSSASENTQPFLSEYVQIISGNFPPVKRKNKNPDVWREDFP